MSKKRLGLLMVGITVFLVGCQNTLMDHRLDDRENRLDRALEQADREKSNADTANAATAETSEHDTASRATAARSTDPRRANEAVISESVAKLQAQAEAQAEAVERFRAEQAAKAAQGETSEPEESSEVVPAAAQTTEPASSVSPAQQTPSPTTDEPAEQAEPAAQPSTTPKSGSGNPLRGGVSAATGDGANAWDESADSMLCSASIPADAPPETAEPDSGKTREPAATAATPPQGAEPARHEPTVPRQKDIHAQYRYAQSLGTIEAFQAVLDYFPNPAQNDWTQRALVALAQEDIRRLRAVQPVSTTTAQATSAQPIAETPVSAPAGDSPVDPTADETWRKTLDQTAEQLRMHLDSGGLSADQTARLQACLRLLYLIDGEGGNATRPIESLSPSEQAYWQHQVYALSLYLENLGGPAAENGNLLALRELRRAECELAGITPKLDVSNLAFCKKVNSYGNFEPFDKPSFYPDQEVLLYCEIDNFTVQTADDGLFETSLQGSYQVYDASGRRVADHSFPLQKERCQKQRRDYFIPYRMWIPKKNVFPGTYTLQLTIEDTLGNKFGQSSIQFEIVVPEQVD